MSSASSQAQVEIDTQNAEFWNTLCGTALAQSLGIVDRSPESLRKFDNWYFRFYPYLSDHIPFHALRGRRVLEVGLGYGTVSQRLAEGGAGFLTLYADAVALALAGAAIAFPPLGIVAVIAFVLLLLRARAGGERKYEGLRVLR